MAIYDLVIVGAGPAGLAAAIAAKRAGLNFRILEKGALVNSIFRFPSQMVFFTTPDLLEIGDLPFVTPHGKPTRDETLRYYRRVVEAFDLEIDYGVTVTEIKTGAADEPFSIDTEHEHEGQMIFLAQTVIVASGCYDHPNQLSIPGEELPHVSHYFTESHGFFQKHVVIVGGKNSAAEAALELYRSGASVTLVHRRAELGSSIKYWVKPDIENRIKEGSIKAYFETNVIEIRPKKMVIGQDEERKTIPADGVFLLTGYLADLDFLKRCGIVVRSNNVPEYDAESFETNVPGLYLAGAVVAGANRGEVFIENGRFHGQVVVEHIVKQLGNQVVTA
jgi:thioredoxin reductase (NADPH)